MQGNLTNRLGVFFPNQEYGFVSVGYANWETVMSRKERSWDGWEEDSERRTARWTNRSAPTAPSLSYEEEETLETLDILEDDAHDWDDLDDAYGDDGLRGGDEFDSRFD